MSLERRAVWVRAICPIMLALQPLMNQNNKLLHYSTSILMTDETGPAVVLTLKPAIGISTGELQKLLQRCCKDLKSFHLQHKPRRGEPYYIAVPASTRLRWPPPALSA